MLRKRCTWPWGTTWFIARSPDRLLSREAWWRTGYWRDLFCLYGPHFGRVKASA